MWDMTKNLGYAFDDDKYNRLVLLFEPTFAAYIDNLVQEKSALFAGDKHFVGYYLDNELPFASYQNGDPVKGIDLSIFYPCPIVIKLPGFMRRSLCKKEGLLLRRQ